MWLCQRSAFFPHLSSAFWIALGQFRRERFSRTGLASEELAKTRAVAEDYFDDIEGFAVLHVKAVHEWLQISIYDSVPPLSLVRGRLFLRRETPRACELLLEETHRIRTRSNHVLCLARTPLLCQTRMIACPASTPAPSSLRRTPAPESEHGWSK
jgi:hypothetical protein